MTVTSLGEDWLANNAVITFVGALLLGQSWSMPAGTVKLFGIFTVWDYAGWVVLSVIVALLVFSVFCAVAAIVPVLRRWALREGSYWSPSLSFLTWLVFTATLPSALIQLPLDQWWSLGLLFVGVFLCLFLLFRCFQQASQVHHVRGSPVSRANP